MLENLVNIIFVIAVSLAFVLLLVLIYKDKKNRQKISDCKAENYELFDKCSKLESEIKSAVKDRDETKNMIYKYTDWQSHILNTFSLDEKDVIKTIHTIHKSYSVSNRNKIVLMKLMISYILNHKVSEDIFDNLDTSKTISSSINVLNSYYINKELSDSLNYDKTIISSLMSLILYKPKSKTY